MTWLVTQVSATISIDLDMDEFLAFLGLGLSLA
jgi:hypothetical protein